MPSPAVRSALENCPTLARTVGAVIDNAPTSTELDPKTGTAMLM